MRMTPELSFRNAVRANLSTLDDRIENILASLIGHGYPAEVHALSFEVFSESFTSGFPVRAFFLDRTNTEHFVCVNGKATYPSPVDPGLIEIDHVYPQELEDEFDATAPEPNAWEIATDELVAWFAERWRRAGGARFPLACTIGCHDAPDELNLVSGARQPRYASFVP